MIEPELERHLVRIENRLNEIRQSPSIWKSLSNGIFSGAGYVIGGIAIIILLGWILNLLGIIPGFSSIVSAIQNAMQVRR